MTLMDWMGGKTSTQSIKNLNLDGPFLRYAMFSGEGTHFQKVCQISLDPRSPTPCKGAYSKSRVDLVTKGLLDKSRSLWPGVKYESKQEVVSLVNP